LWFALPAFGEDQYFHSNGMQIRYLDEGTGSPAIVGRLDLAIIGVRLLKQAMPSLDVVVVEGAGHGRRLAIRIFPRRSGCFS
jgi:hypothetical protein